MIYTQTDAEPARAKCRGFEGRHFGFEAKLAAFDAAAVSYGQLLFRKSLKVAKYSKEIELLVFIADIPVTESVVTKRPHPPPRNDGNAYLHTVFIC